MEVQLKFNKDLDNNTTILKLGKATKILGLWWNTTTDTFHYHIKLESEREKITKHNILSKIAGIYNPLRWIGQVVTQAKIILQRLWQMNKTGMKTSQANPAKSSGMDPVENTNQADRRHCYSTKSPMQ